MALNRTNQRMICFGDTAMPINTSTKYLGISLTGTNPPGLLTTVASNLYDYKPVNFPYGFETGLPPSNPSISTAANIYVDNSIPGSGPCGVVFSGKDMYSGSFSNEGIFLGVSRQSANDRRLWMGDTALSRSLATTKYLSFVFTGTNPCGIECAQASNAFIGSAVDFPSGLTTQLHILPRTDNTSLSGDSGLRWKNVYGAIVTYNSLVNASDRRIKTDIEDYTPGLAEISQLRPKRFKYHKNYNRDESQNIGLIADDVEKVLPDMVGRDDHPEFKNLKTIRSSDFTYLLINSVQELKRQLDDALARIRVLEDSDGCRNV